MRYLYYNHKSSYILDAIVGIHDYERIAPQELIFNISAELSDTHTLPKLDAIIQNYCQQHRPYLLEKMAYDLALLLLQNIWFIKRLSITIKKPKALKQAACSFVTVDIARS